MAKHTKEACLEDLRMGILSTNLAPGAELDEVRLSERYRISRTPLREVLQKLAGEGYVRLTANRGAKVASMDILAMRTFFRTAPMVYANISHMAAENRTMVQIADLKEAQSCFAEATSKADGGGAALANHRFHEVIGEMAHNPYLMASLYRLLIDHTRLSQTFYRPAAPSEAVLIRKACEQHEALITAIEAQEPALAIDLTLQHWDLSRDRLERFVRPDPLPVDVASLEGRRNAL